MGLIRVGIVGTGYTVGMANAHVTGYSALKDKCSLVALYDIVPGRAKAWAEEKKLDVKICDSYEELLDMVDAVSIVTPNYAHVDLTIRAIEKGKHVLCEKPLSLNAEACRKALQYASSTDKIAMIGFSYRGIPAVRYMRSLIAEGKMGKIFHWRETLGGCRIANPQVKLEWRMQENLSGTGALADFGCHMIDLTDWVLAGTCGKINEVQGMTTTSITERDKIWEEGKGAVTNDDSAAFNMKFTSGTVCSFVASRLGVKRHTIEVYGEGGMMLFRDDRQDELEIWQKSFDGGYSGESKIVKVPAEYLVNGPYFNAEIEDFINSIISGKKPERNFSRALYIQEIIDSIAISAATGTNCKIAD